LGKIFVSGARGQKKVSCTCTHLLNPGQSVFAKDLGGRLEALSFIQEDGSHDLWEKMELVFMIVAILEG
jgi:hypothetical protein